MTTHLNDDLECTELSPFCFLLLEMLLFNRATVTMLELE